MGHARSIVAALFIVTASAAMGDDTVLIPLKNIWAYQMPRTRDVCELEPEHFGKAIQKLASEEQLEKLERSSTSQILQTLASPKPTAKSLRAFAVAGAGAMALNGAHSVLVDGQKPHSSYSMGTEISVIFFSRVFGYYVHLTKVQRQGNAINISYRFVPHRTKELTSHFAIVPLGTLKAGEYEVAIAQLPMRQSEVAAGFKPPTTSAASQVVSESFRFSVEKD